MTVTRANIAYHLDTQFAALAAAVGQADSDDSSTGYGPDIDLALRRLGKGRSELATATVEDSQDETVFALAEYFAARRLWRLLGDRVNTQTGRNSYHFNDQRKQAKEMMDDAAKVCAALGYDVKRDGWSVGTLNLDWIEAEPVDA